MPRYAEQWLRAPWHGACDHCPGDTASGARLVSLNGILSSALSALQTNSAALNVVANNVSNLNTPGYARRIVNEQAWSAGGQLEGVSIADVQRVVNQFLQQESLYAGAASSQYSAQSNVYSQLDGFLGQPGSSTSLNSQLDNISGALGQAELSPNSSASQQGALTAFQGLASTISGISGSITSLQGQVGQQISAATATVNGLTKQIYTLNQQIQTATASGDDASGLLDQRDLAVQSLSQFIGVRTIAQPDGAMTVMTQDGTSLVGATYAQLNYAGTSANGTYPPITVQGMNQSGQAVGPGQALDSHLGSGQIAGLLQMRDKDLSDYQQELGNFARQTELAYNAQSNANAAFPPPTTLNGSNTGLLSTDALNFKGQTTIAVADQNGNLVSRIDVNFDTGTLSVDGGASSSIGSTVGSFVSALNTVLGSNGSASFTNGALSINAGGTNGIVVQDNASAPSSRGGTGFSQFFGLNDLFRSSVPSILSTGLSASDAGGFAAGGTMSFSLKGPNGETGKQASVTLTAGMTIGDVVNALNTAFGGAATFTLNSDGSLSMATSSAGDQLNVSSDTTQRGTTGTSFTALFGLGQQQATALASSFAVNPAIANNPQQLPFAQPGITASTTAGQSIVGSGDSSGVLALQNIGSANQTFAAAGGLPAQTMSLNDYAASFYQDIATRGQAAQTNSTTQSDRLTQAQSLQSQTSGVNLDEELSNMVVYQQAYSAGARIVSVVQSLFTTLEQMT
jgi:flagellar hook-associated protein 1 FlgK